MEETFDYSKADLLEAVRRWGDEAIAENWPSGRDDKASSEYLHKMIQKVRLISLRD
jgi:hypothetical protein